MNSEERYSRLILSKVTGIGPKRFKIIEEKMNGNIVTLFKMRNKELYKFLGTNLADEFTKTLATFNLDLYLGDLKRRGIDFYVIGEDKYPFYLSNIPDFPICIYFIGDLDQDFLAKSISIVGTRSFTEYGSKITAEIITELVKNKIAIVSGMAMGIDNIVHEECIKNGGYTVAVIPTSPDNPVPKINTGIYNRILNAGGVIVSEEDSIDKEIHPKMFALRNRIVAGLTQATLVIEADIKSGALITANNAFDNNRLVFAFPGNIYQSKSRGTNNLIKTDKAKLIENVDDILIELGINNCELQTNKHEYNPRTELEVKVIKLVKVRECSLSQLSRDLNINISELNSCISYLEIEGALAKDYKGNIRCML
ncbi:DNA-processing protein DprA [Candidatus Dojkabacteria bacterium]|nr:DNA-processing protein DprA [Candidatus Dojkabacteria bacterium]